ncbi:MAG: BrnT family toxin [Patescibacteria group bacterium]|jgi:uncharacterized DUF497 family protein
MRGKKGRKILGFDWDEVNKYKNGEKHRVSFRESEEVFFDKNLKLFYDFHHSQKEKRFVGLGKTNEGRKLFLVFTLRGEKVRIISARDMSKRERNLYEKK